MSKFKVGDVVRGLGDAPWIEHKIYKVFPRTVTSPGEDAWGYKLEGITNTYTAKELVMVSPKDPTAPVDNRKEWRVRQKVGQMLWGWAKVSLDGKNIDVKIDNGATYLNQDVSEWQEMSAPGLWSKWVDHTGGPPKFKVGDVVELIPFKDERVITSIDDQFGACLDGGPAHVNFGSLKLVRRPNSDPAKPSPIVTETRRFIKSGQYGRVTIDNVSHVAGKLSVGLTGTKMFDAEQLREAAHTLNQIAEVLEENASW